MVTCDCTVNEAGGVALVEAVLSADAPDPQRVTLAARVDGPVWAPRTRGVPERPWSEGELTVVVPPDERTAVGFATPGEPDSPPVDVVDECRVTDQGSDGLVTDRTPNGVVRALGDGRPPRDAVPEPAPVADAGAGGRADGRADSPTPPGTADAAMTSEGREPAAASGNPTTPPTATDQDPARTEGTSASDSPGPDLPAPVAAWLDAVQGRLDAVDGEAGAATPAGAASREAAVATLGAEASTLRAVAERAAALANRCERVGEP